MLSNRKVERQSQANMRYKCEVIFFSHSSINPWARAPHRPPDWQNGIERSFTAHFLLFLVHRKAVKWPESRVCSTFCLGAKISSSAVETLRQIAPLRTSGELKVTPIRCAERLNNKAPWRSDLKKTFNTLIHIHRFAIVGVIWSSFDEVLGFPWCRFFSLQDMGSDRTRVEMLIARSKCVSVGLCRVVVKWMVTKNIKCTVRERERSRERLGLWYRILLYFTLGNLI